MKIKKFNQSTFNPLSIQFQSNFTFNRKLKEIKHFTMNLSKVLINPFSSQFQFFNCISLNQNQIKSN